MKIAVALLLVAFVAVTSGAEPEWKVPHRIVGGSVTTIGNYQFAVALLYGSSQAAARQSCGGAVLTNRHILTAAHCLVSSSGSILSTLLWHGRIGSTNANSGGVVHSSERYIVHPSYNTWTYDGDVAIIRTATTMVFISGQVAAGSIAGANYNLGDNQAVMAIGWGTTSQGGSLSEQLRHVQVWTVNQAVCNQRYGGSITANMLCSGWLDVGGRDQCQGDSGGPLLHNNVIVGVCSWGNGCAHAYFPGVNARVSAYSNWIVTNAV